jgi:glucose/arabinose dehydrogenase
MRFSTSIRLSTMAGALLLLSGCFSLISSRGGGEAQFTPPRRVEPADVAIPPGYRLEVVATGLTYPTGVAFDAEGRPHVTEAGYSYGEDFTEARLLRIEADGRHTVVARGERPPWTGVTFHQGAFFIAEGGQKEGGRILRVTPDGQATVLLSGLPSLGDHHTNGPAIGPDGALYFSVGTATNSGVVGTDNAEMGWLERQPKFHDIPCQDVTLTGVNYTSDNPLTPEPGDKATTGAFVPFGTPTESGQTLSGQVPCSGAIFRLAPGATEPELVAWGFRNPYGLSFSPSGRLYATDNGYDMRGSRSLYGAPDLLWEVTPGAWYGWPDFSGGRPVNQEWHKPPGQDTVPLALLQVPPGTPPQPVARLGVHSSSNRFDFSRSEAFGHVGQAFIAQFGDLTPNTGKVFGPVGFKVVRVDVATGIIQDFVANQDKGSGGPASRLGRAGLERPMDARFDPSGTALYIVDFGVLTLDEQKNLHPFKQTGVLWRVTRAPEGQQP